jgi:hypothetical protein
MPETFCSERLTRKWAEDLEKREQQKQQLRQEADLLLAPSGRLVTGGNARMLPDELGDVTSNKNQIAPNKSCTHDNSGGNPGVLIYTSDWATYVRYTTSESKLGQLEHAYVTYLGASDEFGTFLLDAGAVSNVSAELNGVSFTHRVIISPQESWYYLNAHDAQLKQEAMAFNAISAATIPRLTGFSAVAGPGAMTEDDFISSVSSGAANNEPVYAGTLPNVNPTGGTANCINCAVATDATLGGNAASALPGEKATLAEVERTFGSTFQPVSGPMEIGRILTKSGNGARGVVLGDSIMINQPGHAFNVLNNNGIIYFLDGQTGVNALDNFTEFYNFQFLLTHPGN